MADSRVSKFAKVLVEHSARVVPGDRILLEGTPAAGALYSDPGKRWPSAFDDGASGHDAI